VKIESSRIESIEDGSGSGKKGDRRSRLLLFTLSSNLKSFASQVWGVRREKGQCSGLFQSQRMC
jgi:hypothetical protein